MEVHFEETELKRSYVTDDKVVVYGNNFPDGVSLTKQPGDNEAIKSVVGMSAILRREVPFAVDKSGVLYVYKSGVYAPIGTAYVREMALEYWMARGDYKIIKPRVLDETVNLVRTKAKELLEVPPVRYVNLKNGIYDTKEHKLISHTRKLYSPIQLPIVYDSNATCPVWEEFIKSVVPADCVSVIWEIIAWLMVPHTGIKKLVLLLGDGNNGKSILIRGLQNIIGQANIAQTPLDDLITDKFAMANLHHKLVNIRDEISNNKIKDTARLKALTGGGGTIEGQHKYGGRFIFTPYVRYVFSANQIPPALDDSSGFFNRFCIIPFPNTFKDSPAVGRRLESRMSSEGELAGVFNKALHYLPQIIKTGLTTTASMHDALDRYKAETSPLIKFLRDKYVDRPDDRALTPVGGIFEKYQAWCKYRSLKCESQTKLIEVIKKSRRWRWHEPSTGTKWVSGLKEKWLSEEQFYENEPTKDNDKENDSHYSVEAGEVEESMEDLIQ